MAATYSSFMTTRYYSPVFNTALFDGPLRIYFSQSYESTALKFYHLLQTEYKTQWDQLKEFSSKHKEHVFLLMYPEIKDLQIIFSNSTDAVQYQEWEEGLALGFYHPKDDVELNKQLGMIISSIEMWIGKIKAYEVNL